MTAKDSTLLEAWQAGRDADAFRELVRRHGDMVYATCRRVLGNEADAEDVAQECFVQLARSARDVRASLGGWLHRVATHRSVDLLRRESRRRRREATAVAADAAAGDSEWHTIQPHVDEAIEALPPDIRAVIVGYYLQQESYETLGHRLGVSHSTARGRARKGIEAIRRHLRSAGVSVEAALLSAALSERLSDSAPPALVAQLGKVALSGISRAPAPTASGPFMAEAAPEVTSSASRAFATAAAATAAIVLPVALLLFFSSPQSDGPRDQVVATSTSTPPDGGPAGAAAGSISVGGNPTPPVAMRSRAASDEAPPQSAAPRGTADPTTPTAPTDPARPAGAAGPAGRVVTEAGDPVEGAEVLLYFKDNHWGLGNSIVERTATDADGRFALEKPLMFKTANGTTYTDHYFLFARHPAYALGWKTILSWAGPESHEIVLSAPVRRSFVVRDRDGSPLSGARVWLAGAGERGSPKAHFRSYFMIPEELDIAAGTTDKEGRATLTHLPDTQCYFMASHEGYADQFVQDSARETEIVVTPAATVSGWVAAPDGSPVSGAVVWFEADWKLNWYTYAVTDTGGAYRIDHLVGRGGSWCCNGGDGTYKVRIEHEDYAANERTLRVEPAQEVTGLDFVAEPGTLVRVKVLEPETERPIPGARILGFARSGRVGGYADADGVVTLRVPNGELSCRFLSPPGELAVLGERGRAETVRRVLSGGEEELTLYAPGPLGRLLTIKAKLTLPDGAPAATVDVEYASRVEYGTARGRRGARTEDDGSFELQGLAAAAGQEIFLYAMSDDRQFVLAEVLALDTDSPDLPKVFEMRPAGTAEITVTDEEGEPRAGMALKTVPRVWDETLFTAPLHAFATDASGVAVLDGLVPGLEYLVIEGQADFSEPWWNLLHTEVVLVEEAAVAEGTRLANRSIVLSKTMFLRVVTLAGEVIPIERILSFFVVGEDGVRNTTGRVEVVRRLEDGTVTIPINSVSGTPGQTMEIVVVASEPGQGLKAHGVLPERPWRTLDLVAEEAPESPGETAIDLSNGPRDVREDEVAGRIVDVNDAPVVGARVVVYPRRAFPQDPSHEWPVAISDANGVFRIPGFGDAWYTYVEVRAKGFATTWITDLPIRQGFTVRLDRTTRVRAAFELPGGSPSGVASVTFTKDKPTRRTRLGLRVRGIRLDVETDERGVLDLPIEPGEYDIAIATDSSYFARHSKVAVEQGAVVTLPKLLKPGIRFEATLVDSRDGHPIAGEKVWIRESLPGRMSPRQGSERVSDAAGKLVWESLPPGDTRFGFQHRNYARQRSSESVSTKRWGQRTMDPDDPVFEIVEGMDPVTIVMESSVFVTGRVTSPAGVAAPGIIVSVSSMGQHHGITADNRYARATDENGHYTLYLPAGNGTVYNIIAHDRDGRWANAVSEPFHSSRGDSFTFDLALTEGAVIEGRVVDGDGTPIAGIEVEAAPSDGKGLSYFCPRTITGPAGRFQLPPMRSGTFDVYPDPVRDVNRSTRSESAKVTVSVEDGQRLDTGDLVWTGEVRE